MFWKWNRTNSTKPLKIKTEDKKAAQHNPYSWKTWLSDLYCHHRVAGAFNLKITCLSKKQEKPTIPQRQQSHGQELTKNHKGGYQPWSGRRGDLLSTRSFWKTEVNNSSHFKMSHISWAEGKNPMIKAANQQWELNVGRD